MSFGEKTHENTLNLSSGHSWTTFVRKTIDYKHQQNQKAHPAVCKVGLRAQRLPVWHGVCRCGKNGCFFRWAWDENKWTVTISLGYILLSQQLHVSCLKQGWFCLSARQHAGASILCACNVVTTAVWNNRILSSEIQPPTAESWNFDRAAERALKMTDLKCSTWKCGTKSRDVKLQDVKIENA